MARDVESLVLQMSADLRRFEKSMGQMDAVARKRLSAVEDQALKSQKNLERIMGRAGDGMVGSLKSSLASLAPTIAAAFSAQQVIKYADSYTALQNRLRAAGLEGKELQKVESALYETANRNGLQVQATAELYSRASLSRQRLGASEQQLLQLVSGTASALKVQGTSAEAASGPLLQLGQALSGTKVQAEEYNSLIDGLPVLLQAAAKGSSRFGGDVAKLTEQVKAGKVTSKEFFEALLAGFPAIEAQAGASATTIGSAFQTLDNQLGRYVGQTDASLGATARMAQGIVLLANNLDTIAPIIGTLATFIGARYAGSLALAAAQATIAGVATARLTLFNIGMTASLTGATRAQVALNLAMAANPAGAIITVLAALAAGLFFLASRYNSTAVAARELDRVVGAADTALESYRKAVDAAKGASAAERAELDKKAASLRAVTLARINDAKVAAQRQIDEAVAARQRADAAIGSSADARQRSFANPTNATAALAGGASSQAQAAISLASRARAEANTAIEAYDRLKGAMEEIENPRVPTVTAPSSGDSDPKKGKKDSGPTPEELAAQREMLRLQGQAELLKAQGRDADAAAIQRQIDIINLTKQFSDAEVVNAKDAATAQVNALAAAQAAAKGREAAAESTKFFLDAANEAIQLQNDQMLDRLGYETELARLSGDPERIRQSERELFIEERINELLRLRPGLTKGDARGIATTEADALEGAERQGKLRDEFRSAFSDGMRAAIDGDMGGFFESLADKFTDRMLDNLADDLFDLLGQAAKGFSGGSGGGSGWMTAIAGLFAGKRASGGAVTAGQRYIVGERRPEVFVPNTSGTIIPSVNAAMSRVQQVSSEKQAAVVRIFMDEGGLFAPRVQQISGGVAVQTTAAGVAYAQDRTQQASRRRRQSFVG